MTSTRPPLGDLKPGDEVFVRRSANDMQGRSNGSLYIPARVAKASRVWIEIEVEGSWKTYRMRRDTQDEATQYSGSNSSFRTPEQKQWEVRQADGRRFLDEQGITLQMRSPWLGREAELADVIRPHVP